METPMKNYMLNVSNEALERYKRGVLTPLEKACNCRLESLIEHHEKIVLKLSNPQ
jgi:hypothetical protein